LTPTELNTFFLQALAQRMRVPARIAALATELHALAGGVPTGVGRALVLQGWGHAYASDVDAAEAAARQALRVLDAARDPAGAAVATDLLAACLFLRTDYAQAVALTQALMALPQETRSPFEWAASYTRLAVCHERLGLPDEALRWHYRAVAAARASNDPACEANTLGGVGGLQLSLNNTEDATTLCEAAWALAKDHADDWPHTWVLVALNRLVALAHVQRHADALAMAERVLASTQHVNAIQQPKRLRLLAHVFSLAGETTRAQQLLDAPLARRYVVDEPPVDWVWTQAHVWQQLGRHGDAVRICEEHFEAVAQGRAGDADLAYDICRLHELMSISHEALGNAAAALRSQRAMLQAERELVSQGMRARRLTLQIAYELETTRRERDTALQREQEAAQQRAQLAELNQALQRADRAKTRFLAAASHDLRQPIQALGLQLVQLTGMGGAINDAPVQAVAQRMGRALGSLSAMFDTLLDISRMDAGAVTPQPELFRLRPFLARLVDEFMASAHSSGLRLALRVSADAQAHSDPVLLEGIVRNLLGNALKYTQRGGVLLAVRRRGPAWQLQVWDSGPGIGDEDHERIFEEFYRVRSAQPKGSAEVEREPGLGLGLAIVQRQCRLLGHRLQLHSVPGRGSRFSVTVFPAHHEHER
jgi:signal transduction histidine kinase